nr:insulinase family protein [candidate division Zixibacteria bacterium]
MKNKVFISVVIILSTGLLSVGTCFAGLIPEYSEFTLANGLKVVMVEDHRFPLVDFRLQFGIGSEADSSRYSGLANLAVQILREGTSEYPGDLLIEAVDSVGGILESSADRDGAVISGNFLSRDIKFGLAALSEMVIRSEPEEADLSRLRRNAVSRLMQSNSVPEDRLTNTLFEMIYGDEGYGLNPRGSRSGLRRINIDLVKKFRERYFRPNNAILAVGGDFDGKEVKKIIKSLFSEWSGKVKNASPVSIPIDQDTLRIFIIDSPEAPSTEFVIGRPIGHLDDSESPAVILLDYILGSSGEISRLFRSLVKEQDLATGISSRIHWLKGGGVWEIHGAAANDMAPDAVHGALRIIEEIKNIRIPAQELKGAANFFRGVVPMYFESPSTTLKQLTWLYGLGLKFDYNETMLKTIDSVDPAALKQAARKDLDFNKWTIIIIGPEVSVKSGLMDLGPVELLTADDN